MTIKNTSKKKIEANRRNANKSTGPKTTKGKMFLKTNALKYGILSKEIMSSFLLLEEQKKEFREILIDLNRALSPQGKMEEILLDKIVTLYWRQRAVLKMEIGETEAATADEADSFIGANSNISGKARGPIENPRYESWESVPFSQFLWISKLCEALLNGLRKTGALNRFLGPKLREAFHAVGRDLGESGKEPSEKLDSYLGKTGKAKDSEPEIDVPDGEQASLIEHLESIRDGMDTIGFARLDQNIFKAVIRQKQLSAPPLEKIGVILRYETSLDNSFYKASHELQRLQAFRLGRRAHAPIAVDVQEK